MAVASYTELRSLFDDANLDDNPGTPRVRAADLGRLVEDMLDSTATDRVDARVFGLREEASPASNLAALNEAIAFSSDTRRAIYLDGTYRVGGSSGDKGIIARSNATVFAERATLLMSIDNGGGSNGSIQNGVEDATVNKFRWRGGLMQKDPDAATWDGTLINLYGNSNVFDGFRAEDFAATGGRTFGGGGTFKESFTGASTVAGSPTITMPAGFKFSGRDTDSRIEIAGAGTGGGVHRGWIALNGINPTNGTCQVYDRLTGNLINAAATVTGAPGWIDRAGPGTFMFNCHFDATKTQGAGVRIKYGGFTAAFCYFGSGDDAAFQAVPGAGGGFGSGETVRGVRFIFCRGASRDGKLITLTDGGGSVQNAGASLQNATYWQDCKDIQIVGTGQAEAGGRGIHIEHNGSYGNVSDITIRDVAIEMGATYGTTSADVRAPYGLNLLGKSENTARGRIHNIVLDNVEIKDPFFEAVQCEGSVGLVTFIGGRYGPSRFAQRNTMDIKSSTVSLKFSSGTQIIAPATADAIALNTTTDGTGSLDLDNAIVSEIRDTFNGINIKGPYAVQISGTDFTAAAGQTNATSIRADADFACDVRVGPTNRHTTKAALNIKAGTLGQVVRVGSSQTRALKVDNATTVAWAPPANVANGTLILSHPDGFAGMASFKLNSIVRVGNTLGNMFTAAPGTVDRINLTNTATTITFENLSGADVTLNITFVP